MDEGRAKGEPTRGSARPPAKLAGPPPWKGASLKAGSAPSPPHGRRAARGESPPSSEEPSRKTRPLGGQGSLDPCGGLGGTALLPSDLAVKQKELAVEIAYGRLARMAIIGMFFQDGLTSSAWGAWAADRNNSFSR